jgi:hypothetical protein
MDSYLKSTTRLLLEVNMQLLLIREQKEAVHAVDYEKEFKEFY